MRVLEFTVFVILFFALIAGGILVLLNFPTESVKFESFSAEVSKEFPMRSSQFYLNMRYSNSVILYGFDEDCGIERKENVKRALSILEDRTILEFKISEKFPEIYVTCSNISPKPDQENHFIAGEGGPTIIINGSRYAIIEEGEIALYREENCDDPQVALHEILHALGFDHNSDIKSIMYPITECDQILDQYILDEINSLYEQESLSDLVIEAIEANKTGRYLNYDIVIANHGLKDSGKSLLILYNEGEEFKSFEINGINIGAKRQLSVRNLVIPRKSIEIRFVLDIDEEEIDKDNNEASIRLEKFE